MCFGIFSSTTYIFESTVGFRYNNRPKNVVIEKYIVTAKPLYSSKFTIWSAAKKIAQYIKNQAKYILLWRDSTLRVH